MMQGYHQQHQQFAALLTAALPKGDPSKTTAAGASPHSEEDEARRLSAITSLHRAIIYPPNGVFVAHAASYLAQGFAQLVTEKLLSVRHAAARAYGALCSVLCSMLLAPNGRQSYVMLGGLIEGFTGWSLSSLRNTRNGTLELGLESLHEFLSVGEVGAIERYAFPILKACQELLEDERMPFSLMPRILGVLTLFSFKFFRIFQPHFKDIVDILLGLALMTDITESDKLVIMDSLLQLQKHWINNWQFSIGLLSKFLDDLDKLLHDGSGGGPEKLKKLVALLSCFCTVLQSVASGLLEINSLEKIREPLIQMLPSLFRCLSMIGKKFGWRDWIEQSWKCLTLLAEILSERFSACYSVVLDILFQSLEAERDESHANHISPFQVHGVLKTNLQLMSLQKLGLSPSFIPTILQFDKSISKLRLHPNELVTGSAEATYSFLLQHERTDVGEGTMRFLFEELQLLKLKLLEYSDEVGPLTVTTTSNSYSKDELVSLISFIFKVLLGSVALQGGSCTTFQKDAAFCAGNAKKMATFLTENFNLFEWPIKSSLELQVTLLKTLKKLSLINFMSSIRMKNSKADSFETLSVAYPGEDVCNHYSVIIFDFISAYTPFLARALDISSPLSIKLEALVWICDFCEHVIEIYKNTKVPFYPCQAVAWSKWTQDLLYSALGAASDRESEVRALVVKVTGMLLKAKLIQPMYFPNVALTVLERLSDPEIDVKNAYLELLSDVLPLTMYMCSLSDVAVRTSKPQTERLYSHWKEIFALKQLPQHLQSNQLVSILGYISQRWKMPISSWIPRLVVSCQRETPTPFIQRQEEEGIDTISLWSSIKVEEDFLERVSTVNHLAGAWWAVHEAARFCISTKLRTNFGGPTQTFAALERMLLDISQVLQREPEKSNGSLSMKGSYAHLMPMRLLLEFVEALKKNVYNAFEGSTSLPLVSRTSSLFFTANKKVCEAWFSRITEPMMEAGLVLQCNHATIHYCVQRLQDISGDVSSVPLENSRTLRHESLHNVGARYPEDTLRIIRILALSLCKIHEPEALIGLHKWATVIFSPSTSSEVQGGNDQRNLGRFSFINGLVYQASAQYEKAAAYFIHLLQSEESLTSMGSTGVQFAIARIIECYSAISDWKSFESWQLELQSIRSKFAGKSFSGALTTAGTEINYIQALARFDEKDFKAARCYLDLTPRNSNELTLDPRLALQRSEQILLQAMLLQAVGAIDKVPSELQKARLMLEEAFSVLPLDGLVEAAPFSNQLFCVSTFEESCRHTDSAAEPFQSILSAYVETFQFPICDHVHQDCDLWLKVFRICRNIAPVSVVTLELCKNLVFLARKQKNFMLAARLNSYLKDHASVCPDESYREYFRSCGEYEDALILYADNKIEAAFNNLWSSVHPFVVSCSTVSGNFQERLLKAKACLKLSNWLQEGSAGKNIENMALEMQEIFKDGGTSSSGKEAVISAVGNQNSHSGVRVTVDELAGSCRKASTRLCPMMGKSWIEYASWCYSQATTNISPISNAALDSYSPILAPEMHRKRFILNSAEKMQVKKIVLRFNPNTHEVRGSQEEREDHNFSVANEDELELLLQQIINGIETAAGTPEGGECGRNSVCDKLFSDLKSYLISGNITLSEAEVDLLVTDLVDIYQSLRRRRVSLFSHAVQGFINFLSSSYSKSADGKLTGFHVKSTSKHASYTLKSTLYVLNILVNYGVELNNILEPALSKIPVLPWQEIIPQIFAHLSSHPEKVVRTQLEHLLLMLAEFSPWCLIYPTLLDANSPDKESSEEIKKIFACLNKSCPQLVQDAQLIIMELENVSVLWEELWLGTLQDLHADVLRRINLLKEEAARVAENRTLTLDEKNKINAAKYTAMMAPIIVTLERRLTSTSRKPKTPHELWFFDEYNEKIESAIREFKIPPLSVAALVDVWRPLESIEISLASNQKKSISLGEVAPQLASILSSTAPMPGLENQIMISESETSFSSLDHGIFTIASFSQQLSILPTKTKPKKLAIMSSDGQKYTYLLKGREDLRLDARIMQLLQSVNSFLQSKQSLSIRSYSVTPISGRAGLIQWVENSVSIYSVFKSWQKRAQLQQFSTFGSDTNTKVPPVPRPSDMFYGKIIPVLQEKGIRGVISRRDWPHDVKKKVLLDLMKETPKQLLYQELWCASDGFKAFSSKLKRFSGSVAAMSMIGHILGLGDRHLDNMLVDFFSGEIVHIDYNVCFDKGQRLEIPEIVPFRLTQTIEAALGLTGVEGTFRFNCETVLGSLRKNKDMILMLLEAFVWDPLVEWTRTNVHDDAAVVGEERKGMELAVSLSLFASRAQENRVPLQEHRDLLLPTLTAVESALERFIRILNKYEIVSNHCCRADQERSSLIQHKESAKCFVVEAASSSEQTRAQFDIQAQEFAQAQIIARDNGQEAAAWVEKHGRIIDTLRSSSIQEKRLINLTGSEEALSLVSSVVGAGVPWTVVPERTQIQCYGIDKEVSHSVAELVRALSSVVTALQIYSFALQKVLPFNYIATSPVHGWAQIMLSLNNPSSDVISFAQRQGTELVNNGNFDIFGRPNNDYDDLCFKLANHSADIKRMEEDCLVLEMSATAETESAANEGFFSAFMDHMQLAGLKRQGESAFSESELERTVTTDSHEDRQGVLLALLGAAAGNLFSDIKNRMKKSLDHLGEERNGISLPSLHESSFNEFEEQIEKFVLVTGFLAELKHQVGLDICNLDADSNILNSCVSIFKAIAALSKNLVKNLADVTIPILMKSAASVSSDIMDVSEYLSKIRGSVDAALDQLIQVELERDSLTELKSNYFVKVGLITEKQLAIEEAAVKGRDHLSWEEADELASQEEGCRVQLDRLHQEWNQKDMHSSSLEKKQIDIDSCLEDAVLQLQSFITTEHETEPHVLRRKALLASLFDPFSDLERTDRELISPSEPVSSSSVKITQIIESINSGCPISEYVWSIPGLKSHHAFFIWKVFLVDIMLRFCADDVAISFDQNLGHDKLADAAKEKLLNQFYEHISRYMKHRVGAIFVTTLERKIEILLKGIESIKNPATAQIQIDFEMVRKLQNILEEYCNTHETFQSARSAASLMRKQVNELKEVFLQTSLEIARMEWMHNITSKPLEVANLITPDFISDDYWLLPVILNTNRSKLLESMRLSISQVGRSLERLQSCEGTSVAVERQLERALRRACGGSKSNSEIPSHFYDHLTERRKLLQQVIQNAADIMKLCISVSEFEASRDGKITATSDLSSLKSGTDNGAWQQSYLNAITKLDATYHSYIRAEKAWRLAQSNMEAASSGLVSATNELSTALLKAKSASGDLQSILLAMRDSAYGASVALSAYGSIIGTHTALTSECGSMLEEVIAITEDLHDVHSLGKEAAILHNSLMNDLSKANAVLLPLESRLLMDVSAMNHEKETKLEIAQIHGQAMFQAYFNSVNAALQVFKPLVPSLTVHAQGLFLMFNKLAKTAACCAGNLHKALEGVGENLQGNTQEINPSMEGEDHSQKSRVDGEKIGDSDCLNEFVLPNDGCVSPPSSSSGSSTESGGGKFVKASKPVDVNVLDQTLLPSGYSSTQNNDHDPHELPSSFSKAMESLSLKSDTEIKQETSSVASVEDAEEPKMNGQKPPEASPATFVAPPQFGKNYYAVALLRRVEMKIDGRDIADNREIGVAEQVDFLLRQATDLDNLCNMYEGWTPWI